MTRPTPKYSIGETVILVSGHFRNPYKVIILDRQYGTFLNVKTRKYETLWVYSTSIKTDFEFFGESELRPLPPKATKSLKEIMEDCKHEHV